MSDTCSRWLLPAALMVGLAVGCSRRTAPRLTFDPRAVGAMRAVLESGGSGQVREATEAARSEPTGWATLAGTFRVRGQVPPPAPLRVDKDVEVCAAGGHQLLDPSLAVGPGSGLKNVLIYLITNIPAGDPKWEHPSYAAQKRGEVLFDQKGCRFLTHVVAMRSTQRLKVLNSDPVGHNTNIQPRRGANAWNQTIPAGGYAYYEPGGESPEPFPVSCSIHPWMSAYLITRDNPYFAVTKDDGTFEIANLPAGVELEFRVWHERAGYLQDVVVSGQRRRWSKGRFTVKLQPATRREIEVVIDASAFR